MTFRKDIGVGPVSDQWRRKNLYKLLEAGVPEIIASSHRDWCYLLLHGNHPSIKWDQDWITDAEAELLYELLIDLKDRFGFNLTDQLRRRLKK